METLGWIHEFRAWWGRSTTKKASPSVDDEAVEVAVVP